ncbi:MAG: HEAT repeat domain-containing protein [Anaerolineales bacterium]|nr:HEAT repeat domain-containing protein [Anaerolineales bacterium]MCS7248719.1 HEAT repeat domain-containing protein [Anaerolineales bacterium]MDW8162532.1 HEAT repeat domain-containing protein [Anaerolineales bacterium]MDW8447523.1 HEAT repeat domain-containing protein [Anaerolineales bacterium]
MSELEALLQQLIGGEDENAEKAALALAKFGEQALAPLLELANSADSDQRWWALRALAQIPSPQSKAALIEALRDPEINVRQCAALGLRHQPTFDAVPTLLEALASSDKLLSRLAADALIAIGHQAVPDLILAVKNSNPTVRLEAVRALALIGDPRAIPVLYSVLSEDSTFMEYWATEGLDRMGVGITYIQP